MARRIRSLKPEILDDEKTAGMSDTAFRAWVASIVTADDYGTFRADPRLLEKNVWWMAVPERSVPLALGELQVSGMVKFYRVRGQTYGRHVNWSKHQRIDNASKTQSLPGPEQADEEASFPTCGELKTDIQRFAASGTRLAANTFSVAAETIPADLTRRSLGRGEEGKGEEGSRTASAAELPLKPVEAIWQELRRHSALLAVATLPMAEALAGRFATAELQRGTRIDWFLEAIRECAADHAAADLGVEWWGKKLRSYCDNARKPRLDPDDENSPENLRSARMAVVQRAELAKTEGSGR